MDRKSILTHTALALAISAVPVTGFTAALEEIIVTAQKREESMQDVPISVNVLSGVQLQEAKIESAEDLALSTPSINFKKGFAPSATTLGIRGLTTFNQECCLSPSVAMVLDGVPVQRASEFLNELGDVERIEVLRGPQGTLFGRNATAGAINLVRKRPSDQFEGEVGLTLTDDNETNIRAVVSGPLSDSVRGRLAMYHKTLDDYITNYAPNSNDLGGEKNYGIVGKLDIDINEDANLLLTAEYSEQNIDLSSSVTTVVEGDPSLPSSLGPLGPIIGATRLSALGNGDPALGQRIIDDIYKASEQQEAKSDSENWAITADLTWDLTDDITLKSITSYRDFDFGSNPDVDATPAGPTNPLFMPIVGIPQTDRSFAPRGYLSFYDTGYFTQELRLEGSGDGINWIAGAFYQHFEEESLNEAGLMLVDYFFESGPTAFLSDGTPGDDYYFSLPSVHPKTEFDTYAFFGDVTFDVSETVQVFAGLRWSWQDMDIDFKRDDWAGPAGSYDAMGQFIPSAVFDNSNPDFVKIDVDGLNSTPLIASFPAAGTYAAFQSQTRFTRKDRSEDWSGRLGVNWDVNDMLRLYASASRGFIAAGSSVGRITFYDNSVLEPSVAEAFELGFKSNLLDGSMRLNGALFWQETTDLQTTRLIPGTVTTDSFNAGTLTAQGLELDLTWAATDSLTLNGSATFLDTEMDDLIQPCYIGQSAAQGCSFDSDNNGLNDSQDISGNDGTVAPDIAYRVSAKYDFFLDSMPFDAYFMVTHTWQDNQQLSFTYAPETEMDSYGLTDVFFGITDKEGRYEAQIFGKNVGDEEYVTGLDVSEPTIGRVYARVGRYDPYYGIKLSYKF